MKRRALSQAVVKRLFAVMLLTGVFGWMILLLGRGAINAAWALDIFVIMISLYFLNRNPGLLANRKLLIATATFFLTGMAGFARLLLWI